MANCSIINCDCPVRHDSIWCAAHTRLVRKIGLARAKKYEFKPRAKKGTVHATPDGYLRFTVDKGKRLLEHRIIAEKALGKPLPVRAIIHHVDGERDNNGNTNLVICPDREYHILLHLREKAFKYVRAENFQDTWGIRQFSSGLITAHFDVGKRRYAIYSGRDSLVTVVKERIKAVKLYLAFVPLELHYNYSEIGRSS